MDLAIECQKRPADSKPNALRRDGKIPAVLYGHNGTDSVSLTIDAKAASLLVRDASLNNTLIQVNVPDLPWSGKALLREIQAHPWKRTLYHISFFSVSSHEYIDVTVPLHFVGESIGVKRDGGSIDTATTELQVRCAPNLIPESISIDISALGLGDSLSVHEIPLPEGVAALDDPDRVVVAIFGGKATTAEEEAASE
jgi:large subunit ribosomal protein L25